MFRRKSTSRPDANQPPATVTTTVSREALAAAVAAVAIGDNVGWDATDRLVELLGQIDESGDEATQHAALTLLADAPRAITLLDEFARRLLWQGRTTCPAVSAAAHRMHLGTAGPLGVALASTHANGHIREAAVRTMASMRVAGILPFLLLRTNDWAHQVREPAQAGLTPMFTSDPAILATVMPMTFHLEGRARGAFSRAQLTAALLQAPRPVREHLADSHNRTQRRFVFDLGLAHGWWATDRLLAFATADGDIRIRSRAAEALARDGVWTGRVDLLRRLTRSRRAEVRVQGLVGLSRLGHPSDVIDHLGDPSPTIRALARDAARRNGVDAASAYRAALAHRSPAVGIIAGLAESESDAAVPLIESLLTHPEARVRAQAVRSLHHLHATPAGRIRELLHDPSPAVVREATTALRAVDGAVTPDAALALLTDPRVEVRFAGYRLLRDHGPVRQLRAALALAPDREPRLARRAQADLTRLVRIDNDTWLSRRIRHPELTAGADEVAELRTLAHAATRTLRADVNTQLVATLDRLAQGARSQATVQR